MSDMLVSGSADNTVRIVAVPSNLAVACKHTAVCCIWYGLTKLIPLQHGAHGYRSSWLSSWFCLPSLHSSGTTSFINALASMLEPLPIFPVPLFSCSQSPSSLQHYAYSSGRGRSGFRIHVSRLIVVRYSTWRRRASATPPRQNTHHWEKSPEQTRTPLHHLALLNRSRLPPRAFASSRSQLWLP